MTDNDILVLEEETCFALGLEPLAEAGGFISWLKRTFSNVDNTTRGLAIASISVSLVAFTFKTVNRYSGRLDDYINALRALRLQIVALEVSHG
jgi:hypothetical protein